MELGRLSAAAREQRTTQPTVSKIVVALGRKQILPKLGAFIDHVSGGIERSRV
jgi:hypothetical protein